MQEVYCEREDPRLSLGFGGVVATPPSKAGDSELHSILGLKNLREIIDN